VVNSLWLGGEGINIYLLRRRVLGAVAGPGSSAQLDCCDAHGGIWGTGWQRGSLQMHTSAEKVQSDYSPLQTSADCFE